MDLSGLPDDTSVATGGSLDLSGLPDTNEGVLRQQYQAVKTPPDDAAKVIDLTKRTGLPKPVVERNREAVERQAFEPDWGDLETSAPITVREMAANTKLFELAHDDTENMRDFERTLNRRSAGVIGGPAFDRSRGEVKTSRGPEASFSTIVAGQLGVLPNTFERIRQGLRLEIADLFGFETVQQDALRQRQRVDNAEALQTPEFDSTLGRWVYGGASNMQRVVPSIAAGIATRSPTVGLAAMGVQVQPETYGKYRARGGTPGEAALGSGLETGIEIGTEMLPMGFVVEKFGKAGATQFLAGYLGRELPTELAAEIAQGAVDTAIANPGKTWGDYAKELPDTVGQTVVSTLMMSGGLTAANEAARRLAGPQAQADIAARDAEALAQISQLAAASKLRARDPQTFQEFVAAANEDGAVQDIYLDARTLQQAGIDPALLAQASPAAAEQLEQALATGGDLVIPMSEYAARIAGTDLDPVLTPHLRTSENAISLSEIPAAEEQARLFQAEAAKVMEERAQDDAWTASAKAVETKLFDELKNAGRFTDDVNTAYATLMRDFYVATASRLGITPEEMFARYPLRVAAERMAGGAQRMEQGVDTPAFKAWFGDSKVVDAKGSPLVVYHGSKTGGIARATPQFTFFTTDPAAASTYALDNGDDSTDEDSIVNPVYVRMTNPLIVDAAGEEWMRIPFEGARITTDALAREAKRRGHDGLIVRNVIDNVNYEELPPSDVYVTLGGKAQIKSAIGNNGEFNTNDPNILKQSPLQRFAQSVMQALGLQQENQQPAPAQEAAAPAGPALDMTQFFQGDHGAVDQTETPEFKRWSHGNRVVEIDETHDIHFKAGEAVVVGALHGTTGDFTVFERERANPESDMGGGFYFTNSDADVSQNYAGEGPDLTNKIAQRAEQIAGETDRDYSDPEVIAEAKAQLAVEHGGMAMPVWVRFDNPLVFGGGQETRFTYEQAYDEETDEYGDESGTLVDFIVALRNVAEQYNDGSVEEVVDGLLQEGDGITASRLFEVIRESEDFAYYTDDEGRLMSHEIPRLALEAMGFDGVIDQTVNAKFGTARKRGPAMAGMYGGTKHFIAFEPTQIKSSIGNSGAFDPNNPDILAQGNRAEITFDRDITRKASVITLFANADLSSFLHEMGHFQLEVLANIASRPDAPAEIAADMEKVLAWFGIKGDETVQGGETAGQLGQPGTDAFANWFGDSKVVDADGKPLVVYHGTSEDFGAFSAKKKGSNTGAKSAKAGYWFSASPEHAGNFNASRIGNNVMPVYLALRNPLIVDHTGLGTLEAHPAVGTNAEIIRTEAIKEAKKRGHDGVIFKNTYDTYAVKADGSGPSRTDLYIAFDPTQIKSALGNNGEYNPNDPNILRQGDDQTAPDPANLPKRRTALEVWQAMSLEEKRPYHEMFARGFEAYLFEGKAPSQELTGLFSRFRAWLINVYKSVKALNVEISDDIRQVFDRLVATDEAIKQAEAMRSYAPLFKSAEEMGDAEMWAEYQRTGAEATQDAVDGLQRRSMRDMQWLTNARGRILKQLQADAKAKRKAVEQEVRAEVRAMPVYAVQRFLKRGEMTAPDGEQVKVEKGHRLDTAALAEMYPETMLARPALERLQGMTRKDGLQPDLVAEMFGFTSGDQLVREIIAATHEAELIEGLTDQRVIERYGDLANPDTLARAADEAIHNEARARFVATELKALSKAMTPVRAITKAAKDFAAATIARKKVRDIKPSQHSAAETRAAKAAEKAMIAGDTVTAAVEKRNQLVQNYSTRLSYEALDEIDKAVKYLRKFDSEGTRKNLDTEYVDQIDQLLERFDLRASVSNKAADKRANLLAWVESQRDQGFEPDIPAELLTEALRKPYRELTLEELRGLVDTVKQIEHLGRLKQKLLTAKDEREFKAIRDEIAASIEANAKGTRDLRTRETTGAMLAEAGNRFLAMHRKMASVAREMDGFADGGPMWEYFIRSMNEAGDRETTRRAEATARLYELVKPLVAQGKMGGKGQFFPTLGGSYNREERIAIALNLGNAGNMQRMLDGEGWTMTRLQPLLDTITPAEAGFVQAVWDFFESYRPEIGAKERRIYGKEPNWVEPQPVTLGGKTLKGGYYPIKYDPARSGRAEAFADAEAAKAQMRGAYTTATTRRSFTKARAEEVTGRPLLYSFAGLYQGTNEVIHDLSWHEWLVDVNRLLRSLDGPIRTHYGAETVGIFKKAIEDIAAGDVPAQNVFERGLNHTRTGATIAGLGWNLMTSLLQPIGLTQSMVRVGPGWVVKGMSQWIKAPLDTLTEINSKSAMMASRAQTMQREINEIQNQVRGSKLDPVRGTFFTLIQKMQMVADVPTWLGAYEKHIAAGEAEARAVALADQAVLDAQGGGQMKDLSQIQRGHPALKLFTNFYSFFNVAYNLGVEQTKQKISNPKLYPSLALDYLLLYVLPAAFVTVMKEAITGGADDDEEKLVKKIIADQISYVLGLLVGLREVTAAAQKVAGVERFKGSYGGPAGLRLFQEIDKLGQQIGQGDADMAAFKAANNVGGILFHYPSGQINRSVEGVAAMVEGKTANPMAVVVGPPKP